MNSKSLLAVSTEVWLNHSKWQHKAIPDILSSIRSCAISGLCLVWVVLMQSSLGPVSYRAVCQMCPRCRCEHREVRGRKWMWLRGAGEPSGALWVHLCLTALPWEISLRGSFPSLSRCCNAPQRSMERFHWSSQSALNLQSAAGFSG